MVHALAEECLDVEVDGRSWRMTAVTNQDALLDSADDFEHFPFGLLLWDSAIGLARHLSGAPRLVAGQRVLELGCGVGLTGLVARSLGADVWQTDHQRAALRLAERNAAQNGVTGVIRFVADWRTWNHGELYDVLLGADVTYDRPMHFYLEQIFLHSLAPGGRVLLSDPGRPQTLEFVARLEKRGWQVALDVTPFPPTTEAESARHVPNSVRPSIDVTVFSLTREKHEQVT